MLTIDNDRSAWELEGSLSHGDGSHLVIKIAFRERFEKLSHVVRADIRVNRLCNLNVNCRDLQDGTEVLDIVVNRLVRDDC